VQLPSVTFGVGVEKINLIDGGSETTPGGRVNSPASYDCCRHSFVRRFGLSAACLIVATFNASAGAPQSSTPLIEQFMSGSQQVSTAILIVDADIPTVGCPQDGQVGPQDAPSLPKTVRLSVPSSMVGRVAYYSASNGSGEGALGPKGWDCFGTYGSSGSQLFVVPLRMGDNILDRFQRLKNGPAIIKSVSIGETSGRFKVAHIAARLFPTARKFVEAVRGEGIDSSEDYKFLPWPEDHIKYLSEFVVSFTTLRERSGAGTESGLIPNSDPISGLIMANGIGDNIAHPGDADSPYLLMLTVRLSESDADVYPAIAIAQLGSWETDQNIKGSVEIKKTGTSAIATVTNFYEALSRGDGTAATGYVIPEKRDAGPLSGREMARFYSRLLVPLKLLSVNEIDGSTVLARYHYVSASSGPCNGEAVITMVQRAPDLLIGRIRARGC
jgi:hypothetical protein